MLLSEAVGELFGGSASDGINVRVSVGDSDGINVGVSVGDSDGINVGVGVGDFEVMGVGNSKAWVGLSVGDGVGTGVGRGLTVWKVVVGSPPRKLAHPPCCATAAHSRVAKLAPSASSTFTVRRRSIPVAVVQNACQ
jgi:hypothetical protein